MGFHTSEQTIAPRSSQTHQNKRLQEAKINLTQISSQNASEYIIV